ncbi:MAG TPA: NADP-dependent oxidoreductase [Amycolatopsis sp.]|nr:NADP-dependent oxidoreductase [Amycolatopsis sp.]
MTERRTMRTVRYCEYGEPADVLRLETVPVPEPQAGRVRIAVHACGLAPADWAYCRGLAPGRLPRGIGLEAAGTVEAIGESVTDVALGDRVFGMVDWAEHTSAGAADYAIMEHWFAVPDGLELTQAASLTMAFSAAHLFLTPLDVCPGRTILINGAGTTTGYAAVQIALLRGARVIATAGTTYAEQLQALGAVVTRYGDGLVDRVSAVAEGPVDGVFDTAPDSSVLPQLVQIAGGDAKRVITASHPAEGAKLGLISALDHLPPQEKRYAAIPEFARLAAEGRCTVPIAATFPLKDWRTALDLSLSGHAHGKPLLLPAEG